MMIHGHLRIALLNQDGQKYSDLNDHWTQKLRRAASIALQLDAALARSVWQGQSPRLELKRPRSRLPVKPRTASEAMTLRPQIEDLIAPVVFGVDPQFALRPFQEFGVQWLAKRRAGILADDMGLGKTAQALRALGGLVVDGTICSALVVCPKSLLANWEAECARWVPELTVVRCVPPKKIGWSLARRPWPVTHHHYKL